MQIHTSNDVVSSSGAASALKLERDSLRSEAAALDEKLQHEQARRKAAEAKLKGLRWLPDLLRAA